MKKIRSIIVCFLIVVLIFSGCRGGLYMEDFKNVQWTCSDMDIEFTYMDTGPAIGTIVKDGVAIDIICWYSLSKTIDIYDKVEYEATTGDEVCVPLIIGSYSIKDDVATVNITQDNMFDGEYLDKVIYLEKTPLIDNELYHEEACEAKDIIVQALNNKDLELFKSVLSNKTIEDTHG